jgi:hypothetical protein
MTPLESLFALLVAFVVVEAAAVVPAAALALRVAWLDAGTSTARRAAAPPVASGLALAGRRVVLGLQPLGSVFVLERWPVMVDAEHVVAAALDGPGDGPLAALPDARPWRALGPIAADGVWIRAGGERLARAATGRHAALTAAALEALRSAPESERGAGLDAALDARFDLDALRARLDAAAAAGRVLRAVVAAAAVFGLVVVPALVLSRRVPAWPLVAAAGFVLLGVAVTALRLRMERQLSPLGRLERFARAFEGLVFPPAALAAHDRALRELLAAFDPLAALLATTTPEGTSKDVLAANVRALRWPRRRAGEAAAAVVEADFRARVERAVRRAASRVGVDVDSFVIEAPGADEAACPRCGARYVAARAADTCDDCLGVPLVRG